MNDSWLTGETLWRAVDVLSRRPENRDKALEELIALATRAILQSKQIARREADQFGREERERHLESMEPIDEEQMAYLVTGDKNKQRRLTRFREFVQLLMEPYNELEPSNDGYPWLTEYLKNHRWPKGWVSELQELFPKWVSLKKADSQRGRPKKKRKKPLALTG